MLHLKAEAPARRLRLRLFAHDQDRARGVTDHPLSHTAEQDMAQACPAM